MSEASRSCVACRSALKRDDGLRIVLDPEGQPAIDWRGRLPGRSAWACYQKDCLASLFARGALARAFKQELQPPAKRWPIPQVIAHTQKRQRELIGLASRAGELKSGANVIERLVIRNWADYLVESADVGSTVSGQWKERAERRSLDLLPALLSSSELGGALGKAGPRSVLAARQGPVTRRLRQELKRGQALI